MYSKKLYQILFTNPHGSPPSCPRPTSCYLLKASHSTLPLLPTRIKSNSTRLKNIFLKHQHRGQRFRKRVSDQEKDESKYTKEKNIIPAREQKNNSTSWKLLRK